MKKWNYLLGIQLYYFHTFIHVVYVYVTNYYLNTKSTNILFVKLQNYVASFISCKKNFEKSSQVFFLYYKNQEILICFKLIEC